MSSLGPEAGTTAAVYFEGSDLALQVSLYLETSHGSVMAQHGPSPLGLPCLFPASHTTCHVLLEPSMAVDGGGPGQRYPPVQRPGGFRDLRSGSECWGYCLKVHISVICFTVALQFLFIHLPGIHWILAMCWTQSLLSGKCGMKQSLCKVGTSS